MFHIWEQRTNTYIQTHFVFNTHIFGHRHWNPHPQYTTKGSKRMGEKETGSFVCGFTMFIVLWRLCVCRSLRLCYTFSSHHSLRAFRTLSHSLNLIFPICLHSVLNSLTRSHSISHSVFLNFDPLKCYLFSHCFNFLYKKRKKKTKRSVCARSKDFNVNFQVKLIEAFKLRLPHTHSLARSIYRKLNLYKRSQLISNR